MIRIIQMVCHTKLLAPCFSDIDITVTHSTQRSGRSQCSTKPCFHQTTPLRSHVVYLSSTCAGVMCSEHGATRGWREKPRSRRQEHGRANKPTRSATLQTAAYRKQSDVSKVSALLNEHPDSNRKPPRRTGTEKYTKPAAGWCPRPACGGC